MGNAYATPVDAVTTSHIINAEHKIVEAGKDKLVKVKCTAIEGINIDKAINSTMFKDWLHKFNTKDMELTSILFESMDMFGPKVGFLKFTCDVKKDGKKLPGIVFMRGPAVAILTILVNPKGKEFVLCTVQARVPVGGYLLEVPAGMIDEGGSFKGQVAIEMEEETGIKINEKNLKDLTEMAYGNRFPGIMPSPGGCDEFLKLFVYREKLSDAKITELEGKLTGVIAQNEIITLKVLPLDELWKATCDVKALCCLYLYEKFKHDIKWDEK